MTPKDKFKGCPILRLLPHLMALYNGGWHCQHGAAFEALENRICKEWDCPIDPKECAIRNSIDNELLPAIRTGKKLVYGRALETVLKEG